MRRNTMHAVAVAALLLGAGTAIAADDATLCESAKLKASGKYTGCYLGADSKATKSGGSPEYSKCNEAQGSAFEGSEEKYGLDCPTQDDGGTVRSDLVGISTCVADQLLGSAVDCNLDSQKLCGNGVLDPGEVCDGKLLGGGSCSSATGGALALGTLACGAGCTGYDTSACQQCGSSNAAIVDGKCWILSASSQSCDDACSGAGLTYDSDTEAVAGSGGVLSACVAVLAKLGASLNPPSTQTFASGAGLGCTIHPLGSFYRDTTPTVSSAAQMFYRRACACS